MLSDTESQSDYETLVFGSEFEEFSPQLNARDTITLNNNTCKGVEGILNYSNKNSAFNKSSSELARLFDVGDAILCRGFELDKMDNEYNEMTEKLELLGNQQSITDIRNKLEELKEIKSTIGKTIKSIKSPSGYSIVEPDSKAMGMESIKTSDNLQATISRLECENNRIRRQAYKQQRNSVTMIASLENRLKEHEHELDRRGQANSRLFIEKKQLREVSDQKAIINKLTNTILSLISGKCELDSLQQFRCNNPPANGSIKNEKLTIKVGKDSVAENHTTPLSFESSENPETTDY